MPAKLLRRKLKRSRKVSAFGVAASDNQNASAVTFQPAVHI